MKLLSIVTKEPSLCHPIVTKEPSLCHLADESVFGSVALFHGVMTWNNGEIDIAPEAVYEMSYPCETERAL